MRRVFKYEVPFHDELVIPMPKGAQLLRFGAQHDQCVVWALVDPDAPAEERWFILRGTGHSIERQPEQLNYVGTAQLPSGLVFHLFELIG